MIKQCCLAIVAVLLATNVARCLADDSADHGVLTGIDVLERNQFQQLAGRRVGLITNNTGVNRDGVRTVDLLHDAPQVELVALYSPEHGIHGKLEQENIQDSGDPRTGLPIISLYGASRKPVRAQLAKVDTLVFDIQDIGTRFYTFISTMGLAMEAAAEFDLRLVVLDRPNPINGTTVAGPMLDPGKESFVGYHQIPVRHGMTIGELARMFQDERNLQLDLHIVPIERWHRGDYWDATGLVWINPSPNMRSLTQALLYPGIGLLETTNLSVGRGTDTPFEVVGAPWIESRRLASLLNQQGLPGVRFVPRWITPDASKFSGQRCGAIHLIITDRSQFQSLRTGLHVARALHSLYPQQWKMDRYDRLLSSAVVMEAIRTGSDDQQLCRLIDQGREAFLPRRAKYLLYGDGQ
jgi:uncharacterized protein YbbC (DUF1343 family)